MINRFRPHQNTFSIKYLNFVHDGETDYAAIDSKKANILSKIIRVIAQKIHFSVLLLDLTLKIC